MKKSVSRLLTAVVSAAMLTGMMPSVICADDIDGAADSVAADVVSSGEDTAAAAQEVTASVSLTDLITGLPSVRTAADDSTVTGQSGAFDGNLTIAFDAADILSPLAGLLSDSGADGVTIGNPDGASENAVTAVLHFPDYVTLGTASATDDLASVRTDVKTDDSTKTATVSFVVKDSDAASFLSHYEADQTDLGSGAEGTTKTADDGAGTVRADVITIPMSGDVGSGTSFASLEGAVSAATPDTGITLTAGTGTVTYSFSGSSAPVSAGEAEEEQPSSDGTSLMEPEETSSAAENEPAPDSQASPAVSEPEGAFSGSDSTDVSRGEENQLLPSEAASSETASSETASSETASSETASSETASSETASSETASSETASSEAASSGTASSGTDSSKSGSSSPEADTVSELYTVFYDFSAQDGTELPVDVMDQLPKDGTKYKAGTKVTAQAPARTTVEEPEGTWTFAGYDHSSLTVTADGDNTFYGIWTFKSAETYEVKYQFVSDNDQYKLPDAVMELIPGDGNEYTAGSTVTARKPAASKVSVSDGTWNFLGYDQDSAVVEDSDITFTGTWSFEKKEVKTYNVHYTFVSGTEGFGIPDDVAALLPSDGNEYESGQEVRAISPAETTLTVGSWIWTFAGYDQSKKTVGDSDITFTGTWTCRKNIDPNEKVTLKIVKKWVDSGNAAKARPSSISVTLYKNGTKYETFTCKAPTKTADTWTYTLPALPKYEDEKEISWTVDEAAVQGYSKSIDGMVITNTYGTKVNAAKTGDTSPIGLYVGVAVAALAVVVILLIAGRRKKK